MPPRIFITLFLTLVLPFALPEAKTWAQSVIVKSPAFAAGTMIPRVYTCSGADRSPPLVWTGVPRSAKSLALIVDDPDAPAGTWVHWVIFNVPAREPRLEEGVAKTESLADGTRQGVNSFGKVGYDGPCPPPGDPHHYHFRLFALDSILNLRAGAGAADLEAATRGHVVATAEIIGKFGR
jgi:Raf kinase inhibitor-like YbhB/YbcL family protein